MRFLPHELAPWQQRLGLSLWGVLMCMAAAVALIPPSQLPLLPVILEPIRHHVLPEKAMFGPLAYMVLITAVVWFETRRPCRPQPILSVSFRQDLMWYAIRLVSFVFLLGAYAKLLEAIYHRYFDYLTLDIVAEWHPAVRFIVAVLVTDFLRWLSHLIRHKVPVFWAFHAVHHSQRELNLFTDARVHPVDLMISSTIKFLPMFMFQNAFPIVLLWAIWETVYPKFYHANVKLNLGPLRYILVTPQSHRIHHSREPEHADRNFGFNFCIWDRLFGTHWNGSEDYPETGIDDAGFPHESTGGLRVLCINFCLQLLYPFRTVYAMGRERIAAGRN